MKSNSSHEVQIHLLPVTPLNFRNWHVGNMFKSDEPPVGHFLLEVKPHNWQNFSSFLAILEQFKLLPIETEEIKVIESLIQSIGSKNGSLLESENHMDFLAHAVTHSIMRRISRESVFTSEIIDKGARLINRIISRMAGLKCVSVPHADYLDRLSLKVLIRALLVQNKEEDFEWHWHFDSDILDQRNELPKNILIYSRHQFFQKALRICMPNLIHGQEKQSFQLKETLKATPMIMDINYALVLQNYDACFQWSEDLLLSVDEEVRAEALRLRGIAAVNIGLIQEAMSCFNMAEKITNRIGKKAHISYLQGLVEAKRNYNLQISESHYERGLTYLETNTNLYPDDPLLEKAWIFNGLAMNQVLKGKRLDNNQEYYNKAFYLVQDAFKLILNSNQNPAVYLRYNLIANTAFLFEIQKKYSLAIKAFKRAFDIEIDINTFQGKSWETTIGYRLACLHLRNRDFVEAITIIRRIEGLESQKSNPYFHERILRAYGFTLLELNQYQDAQLIYEKGLEICRKERSAEGAIEHFKGVSYSLVAQGEIELFMTLRTTMEIEEAIILEITEIIQDSDELLNFLKPSYPSPKLPAYLIEIDLENVPAVDLNRYLGNPMESSGIPDFKIG